MNLKDLLQKLIKPEEHSLKVKSMRAAFWSLFGKFGSFFLRFLSSIILTRILFPEAFGIMATASIILTLIQLFSDTGIRTAIIQNQRGSEPEFLNAAWIIAILRGLFLACFVLLIASPLAGFYEQPELKTIMMIMAVSLFIEGFENPAISLLVKNFRTEKQVIFEITTHLLTIITTIILALTYRSVYALAFGSVSLVIFRLIGSYIIQPYSPRLRWDKKAGAELFHFGKFIFINTMITWTAMNIDILLIGKLLNMEMLGLYQLGINLGGIIAMISVQVVAQAYLPAVSSVAGDLPRVIRIYERTLALLLAAAVPAAMALVLFSHEIIRLIYDPRYQMSYIVVAWFTLGGMFRIISQISGTTFIARGKPAYETLSMTAGLILVVVLLPTGIRYGGLQGAAISMTAAFILVGIIECALLMRIYHFPFKIVARPWLQVLLTGGSMAALFSLLRPVLTSEHLYSIPFMFIIFILGIGISAGIYILMEGRNPFRDVSLDNDEPS
ncbi:MAG: oligosaccharide flippase family protein [Nitrospira sp.]|nr:oligosaccharide flippase family protein [bacterium]MBL7047947.1 oligosaccharide flippase family protein [Nitrospira sp.]